MTCGASGFLSWRVRRCRKTVAFSHSFNKHLIPTLFQALGWALGNQAGEQKVSDGLTGCLSCAKGGLSVFGDFVE